MLSPQVERYLRFVEPRPRKGAERTCDGRLHRYDGEAWYCVAEREAREAKERSIVEKTNITLTLDQLLAHKKVKDTMPSWGDVKDAFGQGAVDTGVVNLDPETVEGSRNRGLLSEMMQPNMRAESDAGESIQLKKVRLYDDANRPHDVPEITAQSIIEQGKLHDGKRAIPKEVP